MSRWALAGLGLALLAAALRLAMLASAPAFITSEDSADFFSAAYSLAQRGDFALPLKRAPLYPAFLAGSVALFGPSLEPAIALQHLLGLGTVALVFVLGAMTFGRGAGLLAALLTAVNGSLLLMEHTLVSEALFAPLLLTGVVLLLLALRSRPRLAILLFLLVGLVLGLGALTRPAAQAVLPLALGAALLQRGPWRLRLAAVGLLGLGYGFAVGPWMLRNRAVYGTATISSGMGDALLTRVNRHDRFTIRDRARPGPDREQRRIRNRAFELARADRYSPRVRAELQAEFGLTEAQGDRVLREVALQLIRQEPERYVQGTLAMFVKLALGYERAFDDNWEPRFKPKFQDDWPASISFAFMPPGPWPEASRDTASWLTSLYRDNRLPWLVVGLFLLGSARSLAAGRRGLAIVPLVVVSQLFLYVALDGTLPRYRYPLQPLITLVAAGGLTLLGARVRAWLWRPSALGRARLPGAAPDDRRPLPTGGG